MTPERTIIRRNRTATRARLLDAARTQFAEHGYAGASVRGIAAAAGVDAALVFRYFGSKDGIFVAATAPEDPESIVGLPPTEFAERLLSLFAYPDGNSAAPLTALLRSGGKAAGEHRLQSMVCGPYLESLVDDLDGPDARVRAELIVAWVLGVAAMRLMIPGAELARADRDDVDRLSAAVVDTLSRG